MEERQREKKEEGRTRGSEGGKKKGGKEGNRVHKIMKDRQCEETHIFNTQNSIPVALHALLSESSESEI